MISLSLSLSLSHTHTLIAFCFKISDFNTLHRHGEGVYESEPMAQLIPTKDMPSPKHGRWYPLPDAKTVLFSGFFPDFPEQRHHKEVVLSSLRQFGKWLPVLSCLVSFKTSSGMQTFTFLDTVIRDRFNTPDMLCG